MAAIENDLTRLSDRELRKQISREARTFHKLDAVEPSIEDIRSGKGDELIEDMVAVGASMDSKKRELNRRQHERDRRQWASNTLRARDLRERESAKTQRAKTREALQLVGFNTDIALERLTEGEGAELLGLARALRGSKGLDDEGHARYEALICQVAGDPDWFERPRREAALQAKQAALAEQARIASLPQRPAPPPGSVVIPRYMVNWLTSRKDGSLDAVTLGTLAGVVGGLENRLPTLHGARIEEVDGEPVMVVPAGTLRFPGGDGSLAVARAIEYLKENELLRVERGPDGLRIAVGERMKKLYAEGGESNG